MNPEKRDAYSKGYLRTARYKQDAYSVGGRPKRKKRVKKVAGRFGELEQLNRHRLLQSYQDARRSRTP